MAGRWRTQDGSWFVEIVTLSHTPDHHDGQWIRIRRWGYYIADIRSPDDLAQHVALEELLEEALQGPARRCLAPDPRSARTRIVKSVVIPGATA